MLGHLHKFKGVIYKSVFILGFKTYLFSFFQQTSQTLTSFRIPNLGIGQNLAEHFAEQKKVIQSVK